ncbi:MAG: LLM class flavin-dependent oxidoreductase [Gammaproteobacteria bacterium]|nr:LLM class flavin-dependent oxidoreductase [Gammaproteobacteria bacterium]MXY54980.1 LLM class flavin-dependent oxidoreductase [Gammaproteobacteria bacterium]MYF29338.1 LLM class flavin-dependent oxidoreductase [Gammaproteobacteria bacterium]MYK47414.1 LLM class flavin-dependent oxidoreductase [Gammaproteobacteria bacterium]
MHLGLTPWRISGQVDAHALARQAALAEQWGYRSFWLPESHFAGDAAIPDPLMLLAAVSARTRAIRLATTSYLLPLRHPLQAAEQVAVLDRLSGGRVILGVGRGYQPTMFDAFEVSRRDKRRLFESCLTTMRHAWQGEPVGGDSGEVRLSPLPVQKPHPPVWVAAFGPKALAQAGRLGLPYLASPMEPLGRLRENHRRHAEACDEAGVERPPEVPIMRTLFVSEDRRLVAQVREQLGLAARQLAGSGRPGVSLEADDWAIIGDPAAVADKVAAYVEILGMTHLVVTRLRIGRVDTAVLEQSVRTAAALLQ